MTPADAFLIVFAAVQALDVWTTERALRRGAREANPLARWAMERFGRAGAYAVKLGLAAAAGGAIWGFGGAFAAPLLAALSIATGAVAWRNWRIGS